MTDGGGGGQRIIVRIDRPVYLVEMMDIAAKAILGLINFLVSLRCYVYCFDMAKIDHRPN